MIVIMAGLPGTGKSTIAREIARRTRGCVIGKDEIRAAIFAPEDIEFSTSQDDFVMEIMLQSAQYLLRRSPERIIFLDGRPFSRRYQIERVLAFAAEIGQPTRILECVCSHETARRRLEIEPDPLHPAQNRDFALHLEVEGRFEPITHPKTVINTDESIETSVERAISALKNG